MIFPLAPKCLLTEGHMIVGLSSVFFVLLLACYLTVLKHLDQPAVMVWCYLTTLECFQLVCLCVTAPEMLLYLELFMLYHQAATAQLHIWFISLFTGSRHRFDLHPAGLLCALAALNHAIVPAALCLCAPVSLVSCQTNSCDIYQSFCMFGITDWTPVEKVKVQMSGKQKCYTPCGSSAFPIPRSLYSCTSCG